MTQFEILSGLLLIALLASAVLVVWGRNVVSAVIASAATGIVLTLLFLFMQAPDVALSEAAVGSVAIPIVMLVSLAKIRTLLEKESEAE
jgi:energy-converting hydrogenase B subunit D